MNKTTLPERLKRLIEFKKPFRSGATIKGDPFPLVSGAARDENARLRPLLLKLVDCVEALEWTTRRLAKYECVPDNDSYPVIDAKKALASLMAEIAKMESGE